MIANVDEHKNVGVRKHGSTDAAPADWEAHTLVSLKRLQANDQAQLTLHLKELTQGSDESLDEFKERVKTRYRTATLKMLIDAEKHWRSEQSLSTLHLGKNGSIYQMFSRLKTAYEWRMLFNRVAEKTSAAKILEGMPSQPPDDGLFMSGSVCSSSVASRKLAAETLPKLFSSSYSMYHVLRALERLKTGHALNLAMSEDPKYGYMTLLSKRMDDKTDETGDGEDEAPPECDRLNCTKASAPLSSQTGLKKPVCEVCFNEAKASLAEIKPVFVPGYTNWSRMINGWIRDHPKTISTPCWSCAATLDESTVACDRLWCEPCAAKALKLLSTVSSYDCVTWDDVSASDHIAAIRELMSKSSNGGAHKRQKTAPVPQVAADAAAKTKDATPGKKVTFSSNCALCGLACGKDCVGFSKSESPVEGSAVFHKACRGEIFASEWWAATRVICQEKGLKKNKQWQLITAKANSCRMGVETLTPKTGTPSDASEASSTNTLSIAAIKRLAAEASLQGQNSTSALYSGMASLLKQNSGEATACDEDLREFGINRLLWDKKDLAVENARRRRGGRQAELMKQASIERDCFLWDLIDCCSQDLTGAKDRSEWIEGAEKTTKSYDSRRRRECFVYAILEGLCRLILDLDVSEVKNVKGGDDLLELAKLSKEVARESQERVYWVADGTYTWPCIEKFEKLRLTNEMIRAHKGGAVLSRGKLLKLMRKKRIEGMDTFMKTNGRSAAGDSKNSISANTLDRVKKELAATRRKNSVLTQSMANKRGLVDVKYCKWCKRAERRQYNSHDSADCRIKFPHKNSNKRQKP